MTVVDWLNNKHVLSRLAELIVVNGGTMEVSKVGNPQPADNRYGRVILTPPEALELTYFRGIFEGLINAHKRQDLAQQAELMIQKEIDGRQIEIATPEQTIELLKRDKVFH